MQLLQGDAAVLQVGEDGFDGVLCALAISVMPDQSAVITRCMEAAPTWRDTGRLRRPAIHRGPRFLNPLTQPLYEPTTAWRRTETSPGPWRRSLVMSRDRPLTSAPSLTIDNRSLPGTLALMLASGILGTLLIWKKT